MFRHCCICGEDKADILYDNQMSSLGGLDLSYTVARCRRCGFLHANELASPQVYSTYYRSYSKYDFGTEVSLHDQARVCAAVDLCADLLGADAMVVDIGCGNGALLARFQATGFGRLYGVDPSPNAAEHAARQYGLRNIHCGSMQDAGQHIRLQDADLVCVMAVLEHLWDPASDLRHILSQLKPGCRIMVEVPPLEKFDAREGEPYGELSLEHIQFYSRASLDNLLASLGCRPLRHACVDLPSVKGGTLMAVYEYGGARGDIERQSCADDLPLMARYLEQSESRLTRALEKVPAGRLIVYGAGSHTARLLPRLRQRQGVEVVAVVDANPNLQGVSMDNWVIESAQALARHGDAPILVSSYRAQRQIADALAKQVTNDLVLLY